MECVLERGTERGGVWNCLPQQVPKYHYRNRTGAYEGGGQGGWGQGPGQGDPCMGPFSKVLFGSSW